VRGCQAASGGRETGPRNASSPVARKLLWMTACGSKAQAARSRLSTPRRGETPTMEFYLVAMIIVLVVLATASYLIDRWQQFASEEGSEDLRSDLGEAA